MEADVGVRVDCVALAAPAVYVIVDWVCEPVPDLTGWPPSVATNTPDPVAVGEVTVAVYVPLELSVTDPIVPVPDDFVIVTVEPPTVMLFPLMSLATFRFSQTQQPGRSTPANPAWPSRQPSP